MLNPEAIESFSLPQLRFHLQKFGLSVTGRSKSGVKKFLQERLRTHIICQSDLIQPPNPGTRGLFQINLKQSTAFLKDLDLRPLRPLQG